MRPTWPRTATAIRWGRGWRPSAWAGSTWRPTTTSCWNGASSSTTRCTRGAAGIPTGDRAGSVTRDGRRILAAQALRAAGYGMTSVLLGASLQARGWSSAQVGALLAAILAGTAVVSVLLGRTANRVGRRRWYALLFAGLAGAGVAFGLTTELWVLVAVAGTLSTDVVESGPFTSLEQAMLPQAALEGRRTRAFGVYNAVAAVAGSLGALTAGLPGLLHQGAASAPSHGWFLVLVPIGVAGAWIAST